MSNLKIIFAFSIGAALGSVVTWKLVETKYKQIAQEEIDSVKEVYSKRSKPVEEEKDTYAPSDEDLDKYAKILNKDYKKGGLETMEYSDKPYIIPPEEFGNDDDYEIISLVYYADEVLTDDINDVIYDWESTVGEDFPEHFGEYEEDSVFVKNDRLKCYYEILRDESDYPGPDSTVRA